MESLYSNYPDLDGVVCASDRVAVGAIKYLQDRGKRVPEDVKVVGEHDRTLVYTYSVETRDYIWRVKVYRAPAA